jgi:hypothetical protein
MAKTKQTAMCRALEQILFFQFRALCAEQRIEL